MDYGYLRENRRKIQVPLLEILSSLLLLAGIVWGMIVLVQYSNVKDTLPTNLTVAGVSMYGLDLDAARQRRLEQIYVEQPIYLMYGSSLIELFPSEIGFHVNSEAMLAEAKPRRDFWVGFWNYLWNRPVTTGETRDVGLDADYDENELRTFLADVAQRYDAQPGQAGFSLTTLTLQHGAMGKQLDVEQSIQLIDAALRQPAAASRRIILPVTELSSMEQGGTSLEQAIQGLITARNFVNNPERLASVYVMDLKTGDEVSILGDVAYSAVSTIKVPIMINVFRYNLTSLSPDTAYLLTESLLCSNNASSNFLIQGTGTAADAELMMRDGLNKVSCTAQGLGAEHTYISAPLYVADRSYEYEAAVCRPDTPANTTYNTNPDAYSQTTPDDMGLLLTEIYDCAYHGSGLMAIYPEDFTQTECQQMIELMSGNRIDRLIELGVPLGTKVAHKNGWGGETSTDAAIVFSPGGDYVLVMYTWELDTDGNNLPTLASWELIEEVSRTRLQLF